MAALNFFAWQEVFILAGPQYLEVDFLNVGQGDAAFIETPQGHQILIDGGPDSTVLEKLDKLLPFWDREIDAVILTHPELDHMQGLVEVLQRYGVGYILWNGAERETLGFKKWANLLDKAKVIVAKAGVKIKAGSAKIDILHPSGSLPGNDGSIVLMLNYGKNSFLFTGDISNKAENQLVGSPTSHTLKADVLKVAHHGSKYSSSENFLAAASPKYAVISVGKNSYGHPTQEVLQRLKKYDIKILRTDINGDVKFISNGNGISNF